jgi:hypothetical protein
VIYLRALVAITPAPQCAVIFGEIALFDVVVGDADTRSGALFFKHGASPGRGRSGDSAMRSEASFLGRGLAAATVTTIQSRPTLTSARRPIAFGQPSSRKCQSARSGAPARRWVSQDRHAAAHAMRSAITVAGIVGHPFSSLQLPSLNGSMAEGCPWQPVVRRIP